MNNSFLSKVSVERSILSIVNAHTKGADQLTGLSSAAINLWARKLGLGLVSDITEKLLTLGELCQRLSDKSHETFHPLDSMVSGKIESEITTLKVVVAKLRH